MALWQGRTSCADIGNHPLLADVLPQLKFGQPRFQLDFKVPPKTLLGFVAQIASWARLCMIEEPSGGFNGRQYYQTHVMLFDAINETSRERLLPGFSGADFFQVLRTDVTANPWSAQYQRAYQLVWSILTKSSMQIVPHAKGLTSSPQLGVYLDQKGNENVDVDATSFFALLRHGSVHFEQLRSAIDMHVIEASSAIIRKGILET